MEVSSFLEELLDNNCIISLSNYSYKELLYDIDYYYPLFFRSKFFVIRYCVSMILSEI